MHRAATLEGEFNLPSGAPGVVLFAHRSGSSRHSPRNQFVERKIQEAGFGTLRFDLLTRDGGSVNTQPNLSTCESLIVHAGDIGRTVSRLAIPEPWAFFIRFGLATGLR